MCEPMGESFAPGDPVGGAEGKVADKAASQALGNFINTAAGDDEHAADDEAAGQRERSKQRSELTQATKEQKPSL